MEVSIQGDTNEAIKLNDESQKKNEKESESEAEEAMDVDGDKGIFNKLSIIYTITRWTSLSIMLMVFFMF